MNATAMREAARRHKVAIALAVVTAVGAVVFRRPLVAWFTGRPMSAGSTAAAVATHAARATGEPSELAPPALQSYQLPPAALSAVQNAFVGYDEARAALAQDRLEPVAPAARIIAEQLGAASRALAAVSSDVADCVRAGGAAADELAAATSLADARIQLGEVSRLLIALATSDPRLQDGWHVFRCPMAKGFKSWFQKSATLENPYMGLAMSTCGSAVEWQTTFAAATAGPISHEGHGHQGGDVAYYTCAMHPSVEEKAPGTCPICAMTLTPVTWDERESGVVRVNQQRRQQIGLKTARVVRAPMEVSIRAVGRLTYDETRLRDVTLKVNGWIAKLKVNATGQPVRKGDTLFTLYSPDLYAAQQEYLLALDSRSGGDTLVKAAEQKLRLWDLSPAQIAAIARRRQPLEELPIASPASGYVIEKNVVEGAAIEPGQRLYRIAGLDKVWIEAQVYEMDLPNVRKGQAARVSLPYQAGETISGAVAFVYPYLDPLTRTGRVRIELPNKNLAFKPDMYANVELVVDLGPRIQVPIDAVVYTGPRRLVFVDMGEDRLRPQEVTLGAQSANHVEITSGLSEGQTIVTAATFLVAAESRIRSAAGTDESGGPEASHAGH